MKRRKLKWLNLSLIILLLYTIGTYMLVMNFHGFIDYPCPAVYNETNNCFYNTAFRYNDCENCNIKVFLSVYQIGYNGGGCHYKGSDSNKLTLFNITHILHFHARGDDSYVNGYKLEQGESIHLATPFTLHPWSIYELNITNHGKVKLCDQMENEVVLVTGDYGTNFSLIKGFVLLMTVIVGIFFTSRKLYQLKTKH
jgi:uncharacterized protein (UPF0333 family)